MIRIPIPDIREFFARSKTIKANTVVAVLSNVKLEVYPGGTGTLTKTNLEAYCMHEVRAEAANPVTLLIEERVLNAITDKSKGEFLEITQSGKSLLLSDGSYNMKCDSPDARDFPKPPPEDEGQRQITLFTREVIEALNTARPCINPKDTGIRFTGYICIVSLSGECVIIATDGFRFYSKRLPFDLPQTLLHQEAVAVAAEFEQANFYVSGNFYHIHVGRTVYAFRSPETPLAQQLVSYVPTGVPEYFEVDRRELIAFCEKTVALSPALVHEIILEDMPDDDVSLEFEDTNFNVANRKIIQAVKAGPVRRFRINPAVALPLLKALSYDRLRLYVIENGSQMHIAAPDDAGFVGLIMGLVTK